MCGLGNGLARLVRASPQSQIIRDMDLGLTIGKNELPPSQHLFRACTENLSKEEIVVEIVVSS